MVPVTCIMPTCDRRRFVPHAIACFLRQDYAGAELLVVDDGDDEVSDVIPADARVRYVRLTGRLAIGTKRNTACDLAAGDIIVHWDDDDWSADRRITRQVDRLLRDGSDVCGLSRVLFYDPAADRGWTYVYPDDARPWVHGGTLCYRKTFWRGNPFPDIRVGEDTRFVWSGRTESVSALDDYGIYVGTIHPANTSPKQTWDPRWQRCPTAEIASLAGEGWQRFRDAIGGGL